MIIAALVTFGALLACWIVAASEPRAGKRDTAPAARSESGGAELARAA